MDEKLDKEREEAYAASVKYDVAARELSSVLLYHISCFFGYLHCLYDNFTFLGFSFHACFFMSDARHVLPFDYTG